ncbi:MAG TPA: DNA polymerase III subunit alpha [Patescibacteria group bacterium]|nr:DNA polymerase III subunit alpha [Patescibacteria group bacterium]
MSDNKVQFIHLRVHSAYSLAEGAIKLKDLVPLTKRLGMPAVAVTDTGNLFGALEFSLTASKEGVQPIIGCQLWVERPDQLDQKNKKPEMPDQLVLLVMNEQGYMNLMKLTSNSFLNPLPHTEKPAVSWADLETYSEGLICLTAGVKGAVGRMLIEGRPSEAEKILSQLRAIYGDRLYVELERHGTADEVGIEDGLLDFAYKYNLPIVATNNCFFADPDMYEAHDALLCIAESAYVQDGNRRKATTEHYFKSGEQMVELFKDLPEAVENTVVIAKRCAFMLKEVKPMLPRFATDPGKTEEQELRERTAAGLEWRLNNYVFRETWDDEKRKDVREQYVARMNYELDVLIKMGFAGYFLIVSDFIQWAKDHDIPVGPGRGSGAGSVVAWATKITDLDPIEMALLFERFLNPERVSMPDFDVDFCQERREEVINYVRDKYGHDSVAQIITFGKLQARAVVRDVGRVLQMPYGQVDKVAKLVPQNPANPISLEDALESEPLLREARDTDDQVRKLIDVALKLEGLYRHASTHAAGVVIGDKPLDQIVPLYRDPGATIAATQFNMKDVEKAGLVKFDFLGLKTLTVVKDAIRMIRETTGIELDPLKFPLDDKDTYKLLAKGDCSAVFQLESAGMRDLCKQMNVKNFDEIIAIVALFRPGPMENIPKYIANLSGKEEIEYMHPLLEPVLKDTYGVMIYQEQVMAAAQVLAGYTLGGADLLRRAMGKKIKAEMDAQRAIFVDGCAKAHNIPNDMASGIFDQIAKFADYGFNKAHSAVYAHIAFQTAYLKAHYPVEFMAATMTQDMSLTDKLAVLRQELNRMKITLLPPDVNKSLPRFSVELLPDGKKAIRYALAALKGVGEEAMKRVVAERNENGPFKNVYDFARRLDAKIINKRQMESLAASGAFDAMHDNRAEMLGSCETLLRYAAACAEEKSSGQVSLFGGAGNELPEPPLAKADKWEPLEKLRHEFDAVGFYLSAHPLDNMTTQLERLRVIPSVRVQEALNASPSNRLRMAGIVVRKQERTSQKGNRFAFVSVSDPYGVFEMMVFSDTLNASRELLEAGTPILLSVDVDKKPDSDELRYLAQTIEPLTVAVQNVTSQIHIQVDRPAALASIRNVLSQAGQGKVKVHLIMDAGSGREATLEVPGSWNVREDIPRQLRAIGGVSDVREL